MAERTAIIPLYKSGEVAGRALVSEEDLEYLSRWRWFLSRLDERGYAVRYEKHEGKTRAVSMHRAVLRLEHDNPLWGDHDNGNRLDNRRSNLTAVTPTRNAQNRRGAKNVYRRHDGKFEARVCLGSFDTEAEALAVVDAWRAENGRPARRVG